MEAIDRFLDQTISSDEREQLEERLLNDKAFAQNFARAARLDSALESHFTVSAKTDELDSIMRVLEEQQASGKRIISTHYRTIAAIAAGVALLLVAIQLWPDSKPESNGGAQQPIATSKRIERPDVRLARTKLTALAPKKTESRAEAEARVRQRLSRFYLPRTTIENLPLDQALESLQQAFYQVDELGWTDAEPLEFALTENLEDVPRVTLARTNISALSALSLLAIQSGTEFRFDLPTIKFHPVQADPPGDKDESQWITQTFGIFRSQFEAGPYREPKARFDKMRGFEFHPVSNPTSESNLQVLADKWGLNFPPDSEVASNSDWGFLVIRSTGENLDEFGTLYSEAFGASENSAPISISTKLFNLPLDVAPGPDRIVNPAEWLALYEVWSQHPGVDLFSAPMVTSQVGSEVEVSIDTPRLDPIEFSGTEDLPVEGTETAGLSLPFTTNASGEQITLTGSINQAIHERDLSPETLARFGGSDPDSPVVHFITELEAPLYPGQVAIFECESPDSDKRSFAAVMIDWNIGSDLRTADPAPPEE